MPSFVPVIRLVISEAYTPSAPPACTSQTKSQSCLQSHLSRPRLVQMSWSSVVIPCQLYAGFNMQTNDLACHHSASLLLRVPYNHSFICQRKACLWCQAELVLGQQRGQQCGQHEPGKRLAQAVPWALPKGYVTPRLPRQDCRAGAPKSECIRIWPLKKCTAL